MSGACYVCLFALSCCLLVLFVVVVFWGVGCLLEGVPIVKILRVIVLIVLIALIVLIVLIVIVIVIVIVIQIEIVIVIGPPGAPWSELALVDRGFG